MYRPGMDGSSLIGSQPKSLLDSGTYRKTLGTPCDTGIEIKFRKRRTRRRSLPAFSFRSQPKIMSTPAQVAANQANSQHSTGPKTEEGKAVSCLNNFRHGLAGVQFSVLPGECEEEYDTLVAGLKAE